MAPHLRSAGNRPVLQHPDTPGPVPPLRTFVPLGVLVAGRRAGWDLLLPSLLHRARLARWNREHRRCRNSADPRWTDTIIVCSTTAFIILVSGLYNPSQPAAIAGASLTQAAIAQSFGVAGQWFMTVVVFGKADCRWEFRITEFRVKLIHRVQ
jgi:sodium:alanine symporter family protein